MATTNDALSIANEEGEEEEVTPIKVWDHAIDTLFKLFTAHVDGKSLRKWVQHQGMDTMEHFYEWDERYLAIGELSTSYLGIPWNKKSLEFLKTSPIKNLLMLCKYLHHLVREADASPKYIDEFSILLPEQLCQLTWKDIMTWRLKSSTQDPQSVSHTGHRVNSQQDSRRMSNQNANQLLAFKKGINRELSQYTTLKDEKYFEAFKRNLLVTGTTHGCEEELE